MRCEIVMKRDVVYVTPEDSARRAATIMREQNVGFLPVCDDRGHVLGALTDRDLAMRVCTEATSADSVAVADVMTNEVLACAPEDDLTRAEHLMAKYRKSRITVVDDEGYLLGVISITDVLERDSNRHAARTMRKIVGREHRD